MKLIITILLSSLCSLAFSQNLPTIKAKDARSYIGKEVFLNDNIRSGKVVNDSTVVVDLGRQNDESLSVIIKFKNTRGQDKLQRVINTLKAGKATFTGAVIPVGSTFVMIAQMPGKNIGLSTGPL